MGGNPKITRNHIGWKSCRAIGCENFAVNLIQSLISSPRFVLIICDGILEETIVMEKRNACFEIHSLFIGTIFFFSYER